MHAAHETLQPRHHVRSNNGMPLGISHKRIMSNHFPGLTSWLLVLGYIKGALPPAGGTLSFPLSLSQCLATSFLRATSDLSDTDSTMKYHPNAIIISNDEEARGLRQGRSQPLRASRPDYSYRGWEDTMVDAAASDDETDDVTTSPARKRKRNMTDGESITSILV